MTEEQIISRFGETLKKLRESKGLSQESLAHSIQSHATHISRLENGHKQPTLVTIFKICEVLQTKPEDLISQIRI